jgi:hypothetical protein
MSSRLGKAVLYFGKADFGKMLKLEDIYNLEITDVVRKDDRVEVTIVTPMDNGTNSRINCVDGNGNPIARIVPSPRI